MRILFCNKYNFPFSGTEAYLFAAMNLLRSKGHEVALFSMADDRGKPTPYDRHFVPHVDFKQPASFMQKIRLAGHAIYSPQARRSMRAMIADFRPDVAHVRNIYHHLSPSILWELKKQRIPVVYHLNDFKVVCPSYNLVLRGEACEACKGGKFWHALKEKCYPGWSARMTLVAEAYVHKWLGTYRRCVDCFLAPSQFVREKFVEHGWEAEKFHVLPHFQTAKEASPSYRESAPLLYFGRLSPEKGVDDLIRAMHRLPHLRLMIAGDGPERARLHRLAEELRLTNVEFAGHMAEPELQQAIAESRFTVLPSHAYETLGKTILESYAQGRAVVATDLGSRRELVHAGETGLLYKTGDVDELAAAIQFLVSQPGLAEQMGRAGQKLVQQDHTPEAHYEALMGIYEGLISRTKESRLLWQLKLCSTELSKGGARPAKSETTRANFVPLQSIATRMASREQAIAPAAILPVKRLRIAFIGGRGVVSKYSGIESYYEEVGKRLAGLGHEVTVYCRTYFTPPRKQHNGMQVVRLPTIRSKHLETLLHTFLSTLHVLTQPCDVVHYHALGPALFSFIPRLFGKKTVVTVQGLDWQRKKWGKIASSVLRLGEQAAVKFPTQTMVVSKTLREYYKATYGAETLYVPNGGILRTRREPQKLLEWGLEPERYILFLGRFSPEKGCHVLVEAFEQIETDVKLVMAGASSYCDEYSLRLRSHASEKIVMLNWVSGNVLDELLTNAMVFVLPSDLEGLSLALLDAMGAGLCVLSSDVAENREAIEDTGFTFRCGDSADLAERLRFLIANPAVRQAAGDAARRRIHEQYQWSTIASEIEKAYFQMMGRDVGGSTVKKLSGRATLPETRTERRTG